jgi:hypothetical protein
MQQTEQLMAHKPHDHSHDHGHHHHDHDHDHDHPGSGHACCIEDPAGFDHLVIDFLRERHLMPQL